VCGGCGGGDGSDKSVFSASPSLLLLLLLLLLPAIHALPKRALSRRIHEALWLLLGRRTPHAARRVAFFFLVARVHRLGSKHFAARLDAKHLLPRTGSKIFCFEPRSKILLPIWCTP
jgi:hypothetical protein